MPRLQVYLPEDLYFELKTRGLPASELLQEAVRAELRRRQLAEDADVYLDDLFAEVGAPSKDDLTTATGIARRIKDRSKRERVENLR